MACLDIVGSADERHCDTGDLNDGQTVLAMHVSTKCISSIGSRYSCTGRCYIHYLLEPGCKHFHAPPSTAGSTPSVVRSDRDVHVGNVGVGQTGTRQTEEGAAGSVAIPCQPGSTFRHHRTHTLQAKAALGWGKRPAQAWVHHTCINCEPCCNRGNAPAEQCIYIVGEVLLAVRLCVCGVSLNAILEFGMHL